MNLKCNHRGTITARHTVISLRNSKTFHFSGYLWSQMALVHIFFEDDRRIRKNYSSVAIIVESWIIKLFEQLKKKNIPGMRFDPRALIISRVVRISAKSAMMQQPQTKQRHLTLHESLSLSRSLQDRRARWKRAKPPPPRGALYKLNA